MTEFDTHSLELKIFMELYADIIENHLEHEKLKNLESKLYTQILNIKRNILNYNNEKHQQDLDEAVNIFVELLSRFSSEDIGLLDNIMNLKYVNPSVEYDEKEKTVRLIQIPKQYDIYSNEFSTLPIEVVEYEKTSSSSKKTKTLKKKTITNKLPKKDKKIKKLKSIVQEEIPTKIPIDQEETYQSEIRAQNTKSTKIEPNGGF
jgi:viroplasmin and RNaseH domain-containing protein